MGPEAPARGGAWVREGAYLAGLLAQDRDPGDTAHRATHLLQEQELLEACASRTPSRKGTYPVDIHNPRGRGIVFKHPTAGGERCFRTDRAAKAPGHPMARCRRPLATRCPTAFWCPG